jgi:hypothetical protein
MGVKQFKYLLVIFVDIVNFHVLSFTWNPNGKSLLLMDKDKFCLSFVIEDQDVNHEK